MTASSIEWAIGEVMVLVAGPIGERMSGRRPTLEHVVAVHEAAHVVVAFLRGQRLHGVSIIPWPGHSLGRTTSRQPTPEDLRKPWPADEQKARDYARLGGFDLAAIEATTEKLLSDHWPLVRRLADALLERKVLSGRRIRRLLYRAQRKEMRRAQVLAEKDRRGQQVWAAEMRTALDRRGPPHSR